MASTFKNAGMTVVTTDDANANLYTATGVTAVIHALYISNKSSTNTAKVDVKVTTDGGSTFYHVGKSLEIDVNNTLVLDKPINLEANDIIRIVAELNIDSSTPDVEAYTSILEIS
jgi:NADPH:quinone reductase-like Zn-dependent oxidoreductase